jgi:D-sedoheptulose 7-phosphate isomerase
MGNQMAEGALSNTLEGRTAQVQELFRRSIALKTEVMEAHSAAIAAMAERAIQALLNGHKMLLCGNGGSAADAQHLAAELLVRLRPQVNRAPIPAVALALDSSSLTACGNDYSFESYFARMTRALGQRGDVLLAITTSGKSPNVLAALGEARAMGLATLGFLGAGGGPALALCDAALVVPSSETGRVQEVHITAGHALMELIEDAFLAGSGPQPRA